MHDEDEIKVQAPKGLSAPAAIPLLGGVLSSRDEGRVIDEMLFKRPDLTLNDAFYVGATASLSR